MGSIRFTDFKTLATSYRSRTSDQQGERGPDRTERQLGGAKRRRIQDEILNPEPPQPTVPQQPPPPAPSSTDLHSLATRYVDTYAAKSGRTLSDTQRTSLIAEVEDFYDDTAVRSERLATLIKEIA